MGLFKGMKDMVDMVNAAPDLLDSANQMAANAKAQQAMYEQQGGAQAGLNAANIASAGEPLPGNLDPIAGVSLELYTTIIKSNAANAADTNALTGLALAHGVSGERWAEALTGWGARIQADRAVGSRFNALYTA
ncbi:MAG: hypothetical protein JWQ12_1892 [Glaciihabitans sp.]|jgi:hypothetical protein|nr:hypothetical protein [Glaciihabitans sp.]